MATQGQILSTVRIRLDEPVATRWSDPELRTYINEGVKDVARRSETIQKQVDLPAVEGERKYRLPADVLRVHKVEFQRTGDTRIFPIEYADLHSMDAMWYTQQAVTRRTPTHFTMWGYPPVLDLVCYPTPDTGGSWRLHYYSLPDDLATVDASDQTTQLQIPSGWEDLVIEYAIYLALRKDASPRWQEAKGAYEEHIDDMLTRTARWTDQGGAISPNTGRMLPDWLVGGY